MTKGIYLGAPTTCPPFWRTIAAHWVREIRSAKGVSICLPEGMTDAELLLIVLDELKAQDRSATLAKVITDTLSVWWPCRG